MLNEIQDQCPHSKLFPGFRACFIYFYACLSIAYVYVLGTSCFVVCTNNELTNCSIKKKNKLFNRLIILLLNQLIALSDLINCIVSGSPVPLQTNQINILTANCQLCTNIFFSLSLMRQKKLLIKNKTTISYYDFFHFLACNVRKFLCLFITRLVK